MQVRLGMEKAMVNEMTKDPVFKRIDLIAALTSGFLLFASCAGKTTKIERQPWFLNAREYVEGYEMGCKLEKTDENRFFNGTDSRGHKKLPGFKATDRTRGFGGTRFQGRFKK